MSSVRDAMKQILEKYKSPPDAVVNSAGITMDGYLVRLTDEYSRKSFWIWLFVLS